MQISHLQRNGLALVYNAMKHVAYVSPSCAQRWIVYAMQ